MHVLTGQHFQYAGRIGHGAGQHTHLVCAGGKSDDAIAGNTAVTGLNAHNTAKTSRLTHGAPRVGAQSNRHHAGSHRRRTAAGGTAGHARFVHRVFNGSVNGGLVGAAHGKFVHIGATDNHRIRRQQFFHHGGRIRRHIIGQHFGTASGMVPLVKDIVFNRHRHPAKRA